VALALFVSDDWRARRRRRRRARRPPAPLRRRRRESIKYRQLHTPARARVPRRRGFRTRARISTAAARLSATEFSAVLHIPRGGGGGT